MINFLIYRSKISDKWVLALEDCEAKEFDLKVEALELLQKIVAAEIELEKVKNELR